MLEADARLVWREELVLGRHREPPGSVSSRATVDVDGTPLLRHELALGPEHPAAGGPAVTAGSRAAGSVLLVGAPWAALHASTVLGPTAVVLPLAGPAVQVMALATDASGLRRQLDRGMELSGSHTECDVAP